MNRSWALYVTRKFTGFYKRRNDFSLTSDGILDQSDFSVIPAISREAILNILHFGHLGYEKNEITYQTHLFVAYRR